jgi:hypothetical protein
LITILLLLPGQGLGPLPQDLGVSVKLHGVTPSPCGGH